MRGRKICREWLMEKERERRRRRIERKWVGHEK